MKKYLLYSLIVLLTNASLISCSKDTALAKTTLTQKMIEEKSWFLDYSQTGNAAIKTYIGQPTYYINFLKNGSTNDSDGIIGTYSVKKINELLQIHVQAKTSKGNPIEYVYDVISVGSENLILSYILNGNTTTLYYSSKK